MPCGKRPLVKSWDKPKHIRAVKPSRYQQNEDSVKVHWKNVIREIELSCKDEQFWETQCDTVRELVGPATFKKIAKIFDLPLEATQYMPPSEASSISSSGHYHAKPAASAVESAAPLRSTFSIIDYEQSVDEEQEQEVVSDLWDSSDTDDDYRRSRSKISAKMSSSYKLSKPFSKMLSRSKFFSKLSQVKSYSRKTVSKTNTTATEASHDEIAETDDDLDVHPNSQLKYKVRNGNINPHFDMLYCSQSETDMIKWPSKYKQKTFEVSASDEFSKKAELLTKQIASEFYEWWVGLGNVEFKSEIKRPEDIEELFQVWFDEHASRGIKLDPKTLPCVLKSIAEYVVYTEAACPMALKRQIASDIHAETSPAHTMAFGTCLPIKNKHIPPKNNTKELWHSMKIPHDLRTMSAVWEDIQHLTSTKAFQNYLEARPHLPMPPCLRKATESEQDKKQPFVVPSDFVVRHRSEDDTTQDLSIPISHFALELKEVLSRLLNY